MARNAKPSLSRIESIDTDLEATQKIGVDWLTFANLSVDSVFFNYAADSAKLQGRTIQGDHSGCDKPPIDSKTKVAI